MDERDSGLFEKLKGEPNEALKELYTRYRKEFLSWSQKNYGLDRATGLDCFQDSVIILYRNVTSQKITELHSSLKTYLFAIGKNIILQKIKQGRKSMTLNDAPLPEITVDFSYLNAFDQESVITQVKEVVKAMKDPCRSILNFFYFRGLTMDEIASELNYKNAETVKAQKVRCIKDIRDRLKNLKAKYYDS